MNDANEQYLFTRFNQFFSDRKDPREDLMCFGFEHGDGWYDIILQLLIDIEEVCHDTNTSIRVMQVKEKYGTLRFYVQVTAGHQPDESIRKHAYDTIHALIANAEAQTEYVCEQCGAKAVQPNPSQGWIMTMCKNCWKQYLKQHGRNYAVWCIRRFCRHFCRA